VRRILVTGGAGFLGSHLCERLLALGREVICLDDFSSGRFENIAHLLNRPGFDVFNCDVALPFRIRVDGIFNLACPASPIYYQRDPIKTLKTCVFGALNVLDLAESTGARIVQASTSEIYGDAAEHPQSEKYSGNVNTFGPRACYAEGKRCAETAFFEYRAKYGVDARVARIFNTYGPRMRADDGRVMAGFITSALPGESLTIFGDGSQTRSFCFVDDLIQGLISFLEFPGDFASPVNFGNPHEIRIRDLAERIISATNSTSQIKFLSSMTDDPRRRCPDTTVARARLAWRPAVSLADGINRTIRYFQEV
jgi:UDP-glucuronate decarboxylase